MLMLLLYWTMVKGERLASREYADKKAKSAEDDLSCVKRSLVIDWDAGREEVIVSLPVPMPVQVYLPIGDIPDLPSNICEDEVIMGHLKVNTLKETTISLC